MLCNYVIYSILGGIMPTGQALLDQIERTPVIPNSLAIWGLGQMGIAVKGPDGLLVIDPCLSDIVREVSGDWWARAYPPPLQPEQLAFANTILTTHDHLDHLDAQTVGPAVKASPTLKVVATGWSHETLAGAGVSPDRCIMPKAFEPFTLPGLNARVTALPSAHYEKEYDEQ
jgi:L-ascorbate 6-phosphate lactonase